MKVKNYFIEKTENCCSYLLINQKHLYSYIIDCHQNEKDCMTAIKQNAFFLQYVKNQTLEICLAALEKYGVTSSYFILSYIKDGDLQKKTKDIYFKSL